MLTKARPTATQRVLDVSGQVQSWKYAQPIRLPNNAASVVIPSLHVVRIALSLLSTLTIPLIATAVCDIERVTTKKHHQIKLCGAYVLQGNLGRGQGVGTQIVQCRNLGMCRVIFKVGVRVGTIA